MSTDKIKVMCTKCYNELYPKYALGMTTKDPQLCSRCGHVGICILISSVRLRKREKEL
jgi:hypothetical protein